ncbi:MAG: FixH family protein [Ktedonobacteraceae bacterium]|nr:FixH family protein [Ktedonobacteraceae bacterium]
MRRRLFVLALGIGFLIVITGLATNIDGIIPHRPTPQTQTAQAGPYQITLQVTPNPPPTTQPSTLSLQIVRRDTQQAIADAHVTLDSDMEAMDMGTTHVEAQMQTAGVYQAQLQFSMSGSWQVRVRIAVAGAQAESALFEITAQ